MTDEQIINMLVDALIHGGVPLKKASRLAQDIFEVLDDAGLMLPETDSTGHWYIELDVPGSIDRTKDEHEMLSDVVVHRNTNGSIVMLEIPDTYTIRGNYDK